MRAELRPSSLGEILDRTAQMYRSHFLLYFGIAAIAASSIALPAAALAQSAYTTGSAASRAAAGYPSPYGYGSGLYAYAPGHFTATRPRVVDHK